MPAWLRAFLHAIHPTCRGPDCNRPASWTQAAHLDPWARTHRTDLNRHLPLCLFRHKLLDEQGWTIDASPITGVVTWTSPDGRTFSVQPVN